MELNQAIKERHSVRKYISKPIEPQILEQLQNEISLCNSEGKLNIQLVTNEPKAFDCMMAHYGSFSGVSNYIVLVGKKGKKLDELCGYYGERLVLKAQQLGLNTCWVAMSYKRIPDAFKVNSGEKLTVVISLGYGETQGVEHKSKAIESVSNCKADSPLWFRHGVEAALLAPTAMNQQKFFFELNGNKVKAKAGIGFYSKLDLGIAKYNFEVGAGKDNFIWE